MIGSRQSKKELRIETLECRQLLSASPWSENVSGSAETQESRIVGGQPSEPGAYPAMVSLQSGDWHFCGGSLIGPDTVLTAAHCVSSESPRSFDVVIGGHRLSDHSGERVDVAQIYIHPNYDDWALDFDLAVLRLEHSVSSQSIGFAHAGQESLFAPGIDAKVIGWGALDDFLLGPDELHETTVPIVSNEVANNAFGSNQVTENMLAAGLPEGGKDSCYGDSGGPLMVDVGGEEKIVAGIVSWGYDCGEPNSYGIYTRVVNFGDWIDQAVSGDWPSTDLEQSILLNGSASGNISYAGDTDTFTIDVDAGNSLMVTTTSETLQYSTIRVYQDDTLVASSYSGLLTFTAAEAGTYQIDVTAHGASTGTYGISVLEFIDDHPGPYDATPIEFGQVIDGNIDYEFDIDWFSFDAQVGKQYVIETNLGSLADSYISIFDDNGYWITGDDDSGDGLASQITWSPTASGNYFVEVVGLNYFNTGSYSLLVDEQVDSSLLDIDGDEMLTANDIDQLNRIVHANISIHAADLNLDGSVDGEDVSYLLANGFNSMNGDSNLDGRFDTSDLVQVFMLDQFEDNVTGNSSWISGDWNGDREFNSADLVIAMQADTFEVVPTLSSLASAVNSTQEVEADDRESRRLHIPHTDRVVLTDPVLVRDKVFADLSDSVIDQLF